MYERENRLFCEGDLGETLRDHATQIASKVDSIPRDQFLATSEDDLLEHILDEMNVDALVLYEDRMEMEQRECPIDVSGWSNRNNFGDPGPIYVAGIEVTVSVPFTGDPALWKLRLHPWQAVLPRASVKAPRMDGVGSLEIVIAQPTDEPIEQIKVRLEEELKGIRSCLESQRQQIEQFNAPLPNSVRAAIRARKERLRTHEGVKQLLGIPLKRRDGVPAVEPVQIKRKLVRPLPPPPKSGYQPEPGITDEDYEHILSVIRHEGRTFEATPKTYAVHDEEQLRDILLAHLNGHYQGAATGEAFRRSGKTDIRIEDQNRAAFVAECKLWRGAKELAAGIDQLLGYLTWRDCKAALVIFNKDNAKFSELFAKVPEVVQEHPKFKRKISAPSDSEWRFALASLEDEARQVIVNVFVFNLYVLHV